ncbi:MAG: helix-turn-helix domain-containing protein [Lachnospiraceae bacterium]|nr:helix-turn-helix domain-containing protein [Lachnospiraceae bacterium]
MNVDIESTYPSFENRDLYVELGEHIAFYRKRANLKQRELAERVKISRAYLSRIETPNTSQSFSLEILFNISRELNVPLKYFFEPFPGPQKSMSLKDNDF